MKNILIAAFILSTIAFYNLSVMYEVENEQLTETVGLLLTLSTPAPTTCQPDGISI